MKNDWRTTFECLFLLILMVFLPGASFGPGQGTSSEWIAVEEAMGRSGQAQPDGAMKFALPRRDLKVSVAGIEVKAGLALGSWAAFSQPSGSAMLMGDLVLTEQEVPRVMSKLQEGGGIEITALHNHLLHESPRVMYMHIGGHGDPVKLAQALHAAIALTKTPGPDTGTPANPSQDIGIHTKKIEQVLGYKGKLNGGIFQFAIPRAEKITDAGAAVPNSMGLSTAINFQPTGNDKAAITGDFVLIGKEVNPVIKALRHNGIEVTAVHSHMLDEQPRLFFMHFWANDNAGKLATGLRAALDQTNSAK